jgi:GNAT superfamily N-acetyltransferase
MFSPQHWDDLVADHASFNTLLVAADGSSGVVGFSAVHAEAGELFLLFVEPSHAGRGIGRALVNASHDILRDVGHAEAFLFTEERNVRARAIYAAAGYLPDGTMRESDFDGVAVRELRLVKTL